MPTETTEQENGDHKIAEEARQVMLPLMKQNIHHKMWLATFTMDLEVVVPFNIAYLLTIVVPSYCRHISKGVLNVDFDFVTGNVRTHEANVSEHSRS